MITSLRCYLRNFHTTSTISMPKKRSKEIAISRTSDEKLGPVVARKSCVEIRVLAKPGAKHNTVTDISDTVGVQIAAPPVDGEANTELIKYLSKVLGLKKSQVTLDKGSRSRNKTVVVSGSNREEVLQKLHEEMSNT